MVPNENKEVLSCVCVRSQLGRGVGGTESISSAVKLFFHIHPRSVRAQLSLIRVKKRLARMFPVLTILLYNIQKYVFFFPVTE